MTESEQNGLVLIMAAWFGLFTGLGELAILAVSKLLLGQYLLGQAVPDVVWMTPLADTVLFFCIGLVLSIAAKRLPKPLSLWRASFCLSFLAYVSLLLMIPSLHQAAALLLAIGLAAQSSRLIALHPRRFSALASWSIAWPWLLSRRRPSSEPEESRVLQDNAQLISRRQFLLGTGSTIAGLALGARGWETIAEGRSQHTASVAALGLPNVLLIVLDTVRAHDLGLHGYQRATSKSIEELARGGVHFEYAFSTAPWTLPSHASMFTGRYHHELSTDWFSPLDSTFPTLAEVLDNYGYQTAGFVANNEYCGQESGLDRGFSHYESYPLSIGQLAVSSSLGRALDKAESLRRSARYYDYLSRKRADEINASFLNWLNLRALQRPFFAFLNYYDAHSPYLPPKPFDHSFGQMGPRENPRLTPGWNWSPQGIEAELAAYDGSITYLDYHVGLLLNEMRAKHLLERTAVIVVSDHGEEFGEHGVMMHGYSTYLRSLHVPLVVSYPPKVPVGAIVRGPVTLRDLPATIIDLVGLPNEGILPGHSLVRSWVASDGFQPESLVLSELHPESRDMPDSYPVASGSLRSVVAEQHHYILSGDGHEELYDYINDPLETLNLTSTEEGRRQARKFNVLLQSAVNGALPGGT